MSPPSPRLLVTLPARESIARLVPRALPGVPWTYSTGSSPSDWGSVEAMLTGAPERELGTFDAASTPRLAFVQRIYTGVDEFPFDRFPESVRIAGNVGAYAPFVAEHALALALAAARDHVRAHGRVRSGELRPPPDHRLLYRRTAVILGYGEIGRAIAQRLRGFEMRVVGVNRSGRMAAGCDAMYPADALASAVADADVVFDTRPLTRSTRGTVNAALLGAMKPEGLYVNVGRAGTIDEEALYQHLESHPGFRVGLDVWWEEDFRGGTLHSRFPFGDLPNFVGTPHSAGFGPGVADYVLDRALANLGRYFRGEEPLHLADRKEYLP